MISQQCINSSDLNMSHRSAVPAVVVVEAGAGVVVVVGPPHLVLQLAGQGQDVVHSCHQDVCLVNAEIQILNKHQKYNFFICSFIKVTKSEVFFDRRTCFQ